MDTSKIVSFFRNNITEKEAAEILKNPISTHLLGLGMYGGGIPKDHVLYLEEYFLNDKPKVCYDIGASLLHWTRTAKRLWDCEVIAFEAVPECEFLYRSYGIQYNIGVLSNKVGRVVNYYQNLIHPGASSYYKELPTETHKNTAPISRLTTTLDFICNKNGYPDPDIIKIDVQGSEKDLLEGSVETLKKCKHLIIELQDTHYNEGAPLASETIPFILSLGFELVKAKFCDNGPDADYHFKKI